MWYKVETQIVKPKSFFKIKIDCNRKEFYSILYRCDEASKRIGIDPDDIIHCTYDYEDDLISFEIRSTQKSKEIRSIMCESFGITLEDVGDLDIVVTYL
jgi:hypothetical protein